MQCTRAGSCWILTVIEALTIGRASLSRHCSKGLVAYRHIMSDNPNPLEDIAFKVMNTVLQIKTPEDGAAPPRRTPQHRTERNPDMRARVYSSLV